MLSFCHTLQNLTWADMPPTECHLERYRRFVMDNCIAESVAPCCSHNSSISFLLASCAAAAADLRSAGQNALGRAVFDAYNKVKGYVVTIQTTLTEVQDYDIMDQNYKTIQDFASEQLSSAPQGAKNMFATTWYQFHMFYDLVKSISRGTYWSILLSVGVACVVMFLTTMSGLITFYAMASISCSIAATVACLVLLGWHLNIVESMTLSLAVGLSINFTIHYGVAYRWSPGTSSAERTRDSFRRVGPAVAVGALTTFLAGAAVMPSSIRPYTQIGTFLMLVMTFSWLYATLFFQSVCHIIGPKQGGCCRVTSKCLQRRSMAGADVLRLNHGGDDADLDEDEEPLLYGDYTVDDIVRSRLIVDDDAPSPTRNRTPHSRGSSHFRDPSMPDDESPFFSL
jgi:hypothetical protein